MHGSVKELPLVYWEKIRTRYTVLRSLLNVPLPENASRIEEIQEIIDQMKN